MKRKQTKQKMFDFKWVLFITVCAFLISFGFSLFSETIIPNVPLIVAIIVLVLFILLGILFDIIGIAITVSDPKVFHAQASKKKKGARLAIRLIKNANKVSSFCNDVIGDICGIISGATGVTIVTILVATFHWNMLFTSLLITALIAACTIGGKALGKGFAMQKSNLILEKFAFFLSLFDRR